MRFSLRIDELKAGSDEIGGDFLHFLEDLRLKVIVLMGVGRIKIALKVAVAELICRLVLSVTISSLLHCIVREVDHLI